MIMMIMIIMMMIMMMMMIMYVYIHITGSMMGCLGVFFEEGEDVVKKGVLLEIIAKKVS
jgi:hypothetical protein